MERQPRSRNRRKGWGGLGGSPLTAFGGWKEKGSLGALGGQGGPGRGPAIEEQGEEGIGAQGVRIVGLFIARGNV